MSLFINKIPAGANAPAVLPLSGANRVFLSLDFNPNCAAAILILVGKSVVSVNFNLNGIAKTMVAIFLIPPLEMKSSVAWLKLLTAAATNANSLAVRVGLVKPCEEFFADFLSFFGFAVGLAYLLAELR